MLRVALALLATALLPAPALPAQSLRGSPASVDRSYHYAVRRGLRFARTTRDVRRQIRRGRLVRLADGGALQLRAVGFPYVTPATRSLVLHLARRYRAACGGPLVVTSAVRPEAAQPENASERSVHPAGIAVDIHRPGSPSCARWLRHRLLSLERSGRIDATEEHHPAHFHVVVLERPGRRTAAATRR